MRAANAVLPTPAGMGLPNGGGGEWVLTDSAYHLGWRMCDALVNLAATNPEALAGVEICAYGDFMQPMGTDPDPHAAYLKRVDHVASVASSGQSDGAYDSKGDRLTRARTLVSACVRGRPLLIRPLLPSRFVHVGTMPELLSHTAVDVNVLAAYPAAHAGVTVGTWDSGMMETAGFGASRRSIGADGVWGSGRSSGPGACMLASHVAMGARVGHGSLLAHCDVHALATVGSGCLLHDVDLPPGVVVPPGVFMHCVPLNEAAAAGAGVVADAAGPSGGAHCWTCIVMDVKDEVKSAGKSTLLGVPVADAAGRLGLDPIAVWADGEARTTTLARLFPVRSTSQDAATAALELLANPSKTEWTVRNLSKDPTLPYEDNSFDVVTNSLSADYLTSPLEVFREVRRVLKPGGLAAMAFTNRCFPSKVVPCWTRPFTEPSHARIIASYYHYAGFDDDDISVVDVSPDGWVGQRDPMIVVQARKAPAGRMGSLEALA